MKNWIGLFSVLGVLILMAFTSFYHDYVDELNNNYWKYHLEKASDYSAQAAFQEALKSDNIDIGYENLVSAKVTPGQSIDRYIDMMCLNYNMALSEQNKQAIADTVAISLLVTNDGFYTTDIAEIDKGSYQIMWGMKMPFIMEDNGIKYSLSIKDGSHIWVRDKVSSGGSYEMEWGKGGTYPVGITYDKLMESVAEQINLDIYYKINNRNKYFSNSKQFNGSFYVPKSLTDGVNSIDRPTIIFLVQNNRLFTREPISTVTASGYSVNKKILTVGFIKDGKKYYCYEGQIPDNEISLTVDVFKNTTDAAKAGYEAYVEYIVKPIK